MKHNEYLAYTEAVGGNGLRKINVYSLGYCRNVYFYLESMNFYWTDDVK